MKKTSTTVEVCLLLGFLLTACESGITSIKAPTEAPPFPSPAPTFTHAPRTDTPVPPTSTPTRPSLGDTWTRPTDGMAMVYVPAGEFDMGSTDDEVDHALQLCNRYINCARWWFEREQPMHTVALNGFWIDHTEVTNAQYRQCVEARKCQVPIICGPGEPAYDDPSKTDHPVVCVHWNDAQAYCAWAGTRLPTEAEWEYAARGPEGRRYPWGETFDGMRLNFCDANCERRYADETADDGYTDTAPVGSYPAGASWCGALDMAGNVWEWAADWYADDYYGRSTPQNPTGPSSGKYRVLRGGSWDDVTYSLRGAYRYGFDPDSVWLLAGFRCAKGGE
jgi:formylglycine-generating enzyme required for sulfatase activity